MKRVLVVMLVSSVALADPPADAPVQQADSQVEVPGVSVHVKAGQAAPFEGRLLSPAEDVRRGKQERGERFTLKTENSNDVVVNKPLFVTLVCVAIAGVATAVAGGVCSATNCLKR